MHTDFLCTGSMPSGSIAPLRFHLISSHHVSIHAPLATALSSTAPRGAVRTIRRKATHPTGVPRAHALFAVLLRSTLTQRRWDKHPRPPCSMDAIASQTALQYVRSGNQRCPSLLAGWQFCLAQPFWLSAVPWANRRGDLRVVSTIVELEVEPVGSGAGDRWRTRSTEWPKLVRCGR